MQGVSSLKMKAMSSESKQHISAVNHHKTIEAKIESTKTLSEISKYCSSRMTNSCLEILICSFKLIAILIIKRKLLIL